jgi:hypothetical protein
MNISSGSFARVYGFEYERQIYAVKIRVRTTELDWSMWDTELSSEGEVLRRLCNSGHRNLPIGYQLSDIDAKGLDIWDTEGVALTITVRINAEGAGFVECSPYFHGSFIIPGDADTCK